MTLAPTVKRKFAAHETFAPRFGWLRKAYAAVETGGHGDATDFSDAFLVKSAPVDLGVGKNMVNAIRYWAQAFGITTEERLPGPSRAMYARVTARGSWLFGPDGVDPWLEKPGSLWLLHWWLLRPECLAPTWWVAFYRAPNRFHEDDLVRLVQTAIESTPGWEPVTRASIAKDVDCLTKMYAPRRSTPGSPGSVEDLLDSPFRELGLLETVPGESKRWRLVAEPRVPVPPEVVTYACLDYMSRNSTREMSTARLAQEEGAVGRALRLTEPRLVIALEQVATTVPALSVTHTVGQRTLTVKDDPDIVRDQVIAAYYRPRHSNPDREGSSA